MATYSRDIRRGLPRVPGGEPWPPQGVMAAAPTAEAPTAPEQQATAATQSAPAPEATVEAVARVEPPRARAVAAETELSDTPLRRGLPRVPGGEPWPPEGSLAPVPAKLVQAQSASQSASPPIAAQVAEADTVPVAPPVDPAPAPEAAPAPAAEPAPAPAAAAAPHPGHPHHTGHPHRAGRPPHPHRVPKEPVEPAGRAKRIALFGLGIVAAAGIIVLAARGVTTLPGVPEFLERYPGHIELPGFVEEGFPAWARWTHYLNFFFMLLIVRSGLQIRNQRKPSAFFTPKKGGYKIGINMWLHTALDVLWMLNGAVFVVLLFATGHWARIVPTSWEVIPNAASAALQYLTLDWPVEDGWVNYNSLQQLMYFLIVFVAAPLAIASGLRMSQWWPARAERLNRAFPAPVARAIHYPTMLFFVLFVIVHVFLVFATGMRKNLNHMFVGTPEPSWAGFWIFAVGLAAAVGAMLAAKPVVIAPIASLFGKVSNR